MSELYNYDVYDDTELIWDGVKCNALGLPWTFTAYELTNEELSISTGVFEKETEPFLIARMKKPKHRQSFWQWIIGTGTIIIPTWDDDCIVIENVKESMEVYRIILKLINRWQKDHTMHIQDR